MTKQQMTELKTIADNLKAMPVQMAARFERLVREVTPQDRRDIADVLRAMLAECETPKHCERCGSLKPSDRSCDCFDNNCQ